MSVQERVARGARWLDEVSPGWRDAVALGSLDLRSATRCLLGQVFAEAAAADEQLHASGYEYALGRLVSGAERLEHPDWSAAHGFDMWPWPLQLTVLEDTEAWLADAAEADRDLAEIADDFAALQAEWRRVIHVPRDAFACGFSAELSSRVLSPPHAATATSCACTICAGFVLIRTGIERLVRPPD